MPKGTPGRMPCSVDGCGRPNQARAYCALHYSRWRVHGAPTILVRPSLPERFWAKITCGGPDECWEWNGSVNRKGYGSFGNWDDRSRPKAAHRVTWILSFGPIPEGLQVLHRCDNPPCCNPAHLWLGTAKDNSEDMVRKGRSLRGRTRKKVA